MLFDFCRITHNACRLRLPRIWNPSFRPLLEFYFRGEENFAGGKFRGRKISRNSIRSGYYFRGRKFSRKIQIREYSENFLHAKNWCYTVLHYSKSPIALNYFMTQLGVRSLANASRARQFNPLNPPGVGWVKFFFLR